MSLIASGRYTGQNLFPHHNKDKTMSQTLGDILRQKAHSQTAAGIAEAAAQAQEQARREAETREKVAAFFEGLTKTVIDTITEYKRAPHVQMGCGRHPLDNALGFRDFFHGPGMTQEAHPHHAAWTSFVEWARTQGLEVFWRREDGDERNDAGYPVESWYQLEVTFVQ